MAMAVAISPGLLILLILLQNTLAQQCMNNVGYKNAASVPQQTYQKTNCAANQIAQNGLNFNPQQASTQQVYQHSNIQAPYQTNSVQPQINFQQASSQQSANLITNSPPPKQQNQDMAAIFSALYNIQQSPQNQRSNANGNPSQQNYEQQFITQNQVNPTIMATASMNKPQNSQPITTAYSEPVNFQPTVVYQPVSSNNVSPQQNQPVYAIPVHKVNDEQSQRYSMPDPVANPVTNQQTTGMQNSIIMVPTSQTASVQSQPIVLAVQPSQMASVPNQPLQTQNQNQQTVYTVQTQPTSSVHQNQQIVETHNQQPAISNMPMDTQSLMSYVMSQIQSPQGGGNSLVSMQANPLASMLQGTPQGGGNPLASILPGISQGGGNPITSLLPAMLGSKAEKSSSMKAILPLILTLLNDRKGGCSCPNCGYNNNQINGFNKPEPIINTGYSNQINYSQQNPVEVFAKMTDQSDKSEKLIQKETAQDKIPTNVVVPVKEVVNNSPENSEEEDAFESEEDYDEE